MKDNKKQLDEREENWQEKEDWEPSVTEHKNTVNKEGNQNQTDDGNDNVVLESSQDQDKSETFVLNTNSTMLEDIAPRIQTLKPITSITSYEDFLITRADTPVLKTQERGTQTVNKCCEQLDAVVQNQKNLEHEFQNLKDLVTASINLFMNRQAAERVEEQEFICLVSDYEMPTLSPLHDLPEFNEPSAMEQSIAQSLCSMNVLRVTAALANSSDAVDCAFQLMKGIFSTEELMTSSLLAFSSQAFSR